MDNRRFKDSIAMLNDEKFNTMISVKEVKDTKNTYGADKVTNTVREKKNYKFVSALKEQITESSASIFTSRK